VTTVDRHPPADKRCQIYVGDRDLLRCQNAGIAWQKWGGCNCATPDSELCEADYFSWECNGDHLITVVTDV
jgi:hypothetical protein